ncbi:MAG TPA: 2-C-methyl-D-erythritol 4-phosphate cytidylyltransferase [Desulfomonilaceae bacterium]|nr:2-C-methyl-D-erythritol 4-phosphate cytidylyltransferase [Desulfomonilaceae bacterium]
MICAALVTAGGIGSRMGNVIPKQYLDLHGLPILTRTLMVFDRHPDIECVVVTVPRGDEDFCLKNVMGSLEWTKRIDIIAGGETRQESVYNGLRQLAGTDIVAIHDGVRPLVSPDVVTRTLGAAREFGAGLAAVKIRETVKKKKDLHLETVPRSDLWLAHTPQTFRTSLILEAHRKAEQEGYRGTDDAVLIERMGFQVKLVEDSEENIKITTPRDLDLARFLFDRVSLHQR